MAEQPHDYAVVIGLNHYPRFGARGRPLAGAIHDAERFAAWLKDTGTGGGLPERNCRLITSTPDPLSPDQLAIDLALLSVNADARAAGGGRRLYFYFSGHGQAKSAGDVALCLCHWSHELRYAALSAECYRDMLIRCSPFQEVVVLLDCCRVRSTDATGKPSDIGCAVPVEGVGAKRFMVAFAAEFENAAMEAAGEDTGVVRGHFTAALLAGLNGGAAQPAGGVTAGALKRYLELNVPRVARAHDHVQKAQVIADFPAAAEPVFGSALPEANVCIRFSAARRGEMRLEGPELEEIRRGDASTGPWRLTLRKGMHLVTDVGTGENRVIPFLPSEEVTVVDF